MVGNDFPTSPTSGLHKFLEASQQARQAAPGWHAQFEDLGPHPDPIACMRLVATSPSPLLAGFLLGQAAAAGFYATE